MSIKKQVKLRQFERPGAKETKSVLIKSVHGIVCRLAIMPASSSLPVHYNRCCLIQACCSQPFIQQLLSFPLRIKPAKNTMDVAVLRNKGDGVVLRLKGDTVKVIGDSSFHRMAVVNNLDVDADQLLPAYWQSYLYLHASGCLKMPATYDDSAHFQDKGISLLMTNVVPSRRTSINKFYITERYPASKGLSQIQCYSGKS